MSVITNYNVWAKQKPRKMDRVTTSFSEKIKTLKKKLIYKKQYSKLYFTLPPAAAARLLVTLSVLLLVHWHIMKDSGY